MRLPRNQVIVGDARRELRRIPDASVDMVLTSPPYFLLRNYHVTGQIGLETDVEDWALALRGIAREAHRVLTPTGGFWLNVADTYSTANRQGAGRKSLLLGPERLALALVADGWLLRNKIVWAKTNHMPTSVKDRLACCWEALYVFVKQPQYFFDLDSIRVPHTSKAPKRKHGAIPHPTREAWRGPSSDDTSGLVRMKAAGRVGYPLGKNPGDVWQLPTSNYRGAHHATFPVALAERAVRAGSPELRCSRCHAPWRRPLQRPRSTSLGNIAIRGDLEPRCNCGAPPERGVVLDPFFGAGSTGVAAQMLGRDWLGIELNSAFAALATQRIHDAAPEPAAHPPPAS